MEAFEGIVSLSSNFYYLDRGKYSVIVWFNFKISSFEVDYPRLILASIYRQDIAKDISLMLKAPNFFIVVPIKNFQAPLYFEYFPIYKLKDLEYRYTRIKKRL